MIKEHGWEKEPLNFILSTATNTFILIFFSFLRPKKSKAIFCHHC